MELPKLSILIIILIFASGMSARTSKFVSVSGHQMYVNGSPYYFVGTNYWYGGLLGLEKNKERGADRLRRELDFLKSNGITNLRLMAGAEGAGLINGVTRVGPPLQPEAGKFEERVLDGLDLVLYEMGKRNMKAVIFLSNNWEWSGGFQQYLMWNGQVGDKFKQKKPDWDELRDIVAKFYSCKPCIAGYNKQAELILRRKNRYSGKKYTDDPAIMAWELANEPRPMRSYADTDYEKWIKNAAALIKSHDKNHLVTIGHEGWIGTQDVDLYQKIHADKNVDYLTIHIWPKNWGWFADGKLAEDFPKVIKETEKYISENVSVAKKLDKPLVIEEFGLPRDGQSFEPNSKTTFRDILFQKILSSIGDREGGDPYISGANFWAFGGTARPKKDQPFWRAGDELMGDPPMEEQGLNSVFDRDYSTWKVIRNFSLPTQR